MPAYFAAACGTSLTASSCSSAPPKLACLPSAISPYCTVSVHTRTYKQQAALYEYSITTHSHVPCPCSGDGAQRGAQSGQQTPQSAPIRLSSISSTRSQVLLAPGSFGLIIVEAIPPHSAATSPSKSSLGDERLAALHGRG